ncbi:hypothetical protein OTB20_17070 [Streptomyces sp. H27-H1]|uniref:hypothetical protein n=1 Tax=Streptomyces sp. H27-H1 TaxID=2996461 RepID=UPI00226DF820|nr:hypothetical protein [Streptomyces sp. H27-H1]MCY0927895.1 hypothetical protein [Streptomyces sp. H27-H1]
MTDQLPAADAPVPEPGLPCAECGEDLLPVGARFVCGNGQCAEFGMEKQVWRALRAAGVAAPTAAGLPRPVHHGLPVPWVAACTSTKVWWRAMDAGRLALAQREWRCQVCGLALSERAWVLATPSGAVLQAALHESCKELALRFCSHLSSDSTKATAHLVTRDQLTADGLPLPEAVPSDPDFLQQWELAAARPTAVTRCSAAGQQP